jgi:hypothetical protein
MQKKTQYKNLHGSRRGCHVQMSNIKRGYHGKNIARAAALSANYQGGSHD